MGACWILRKPFLPAGRIVVLVKAMADYRIRYRSSQSRNPGQERLAPGDAHALVDEDAEIGKAEKFHRQRQFEQYLEQHQQLRRAAPRPGARLRRNFNAPIGWRPKSWEA